MFIDPPVSLDSRPGRGEMYATQHSARAGAGQADCSTERRVKQRDRFALEHGLAFRLNGI
jgi:hypothetical protein